MVCGIIISKPVQCVFKEVCNYLTQNLLIEYVLNPYVAWTVCKVHILESFVISLQISSEYWSKIY